MNLVNEDDTTTMFNSDGTVKEEQIDLSVPSQGGRRHRGSKKMHKGKRHGNASLRAWVTFVKKVQKEEGVSYKDAMMRAKQRKDKGEKWRGGDGMGMSDDMEDPESVMSVTAVTAGGRRRRRTQRRSRSRASKRSRSHRRSRRHH